MKKVNGHTGRPKWEFTKNELIQLMNKYGNAKAAAKAMGVSGPTITRRLAEENIVLRWVDVSNRDLIM